MSAADRVGGVDGVDGAETVEGARPGAATGDQVDRDRLDRFVAGFDYPMYIATAAGPDGLDRAGCLVGFATQCGIEPFRFLVCLSKRNRTYRVARESKVIAVHALDRDRHELAALFGGETGDEIDKFTRCAWRPGIGGTPLLTDCPRWFAGRVLDQVELGDHVGFLLAPVDARVDDDAVRSDSGADSGPGEPPADGTSRPLMFSDVTDIDAGHSA